MTMRPSMPPRGAPRRTVATRILLSFAVTLVAFAVTAGVSVLSQKRTAEDSEELANGYVPVALKLGKLRAVQSTLASLVDGIPDEKNPLSMRILLETLTGIRRAMFDETRAAMQTLRELGGELTRQEALTLTGELDAAQASFNGDRPSNRSSLQRVRHERPRRREPRARRARGAGARRREAPEDARGARRSRDDGALHAARARERRAILGSRCSPR